MMTDASPDPRALPESPLVAVYLQDLAHALRAADPAERDDVLSAVREHIVVALQEKSDPVTAHDVESVLAGLGSIDELARGLEPDPVGAPIPMPAPAPGGQPPRWPRWYSTALLVMGAVSIPLIVFQPPLAILFGLLALTLGVAGSVIHDKPHKNAYRIAAALGGFTVTVIVVAALGLLMVSTDSSVTPGEIEVTVESSVAPVS